MLISISVKSASRRLIMNIISWKWKNLKNNNLRQKRNLKDFTKLVESFSNNSKEDILPHILMKENIHIDMDMDIGEEKENIDLVMVNPLNTESEEKCSNYKLFLDNNQISNNLFSKIHNLKVGNWFNSMPLKRKSLKKSFYRKLTKWENKNCQLFMNVLRMNSMRLSIHIQNWASENLLSKWSKRD